MISVPRHSRALLRELPSRPSEVESFCHEAREFLTEMGLSSQLFAVEMLLRESLNNALIHGNGSDGAKTIRAELRIGRKWMVVRVADEGPGFNSRKARKNAPGPEATSGRGLTIYSLFAHRVSFNSKGNQVSLWRARRGD